MNKTHLVYLGHDGSFKLLFHRLSIHFMASSHLSIFKSLLLTCNWCTYVPNMYMYVCTLHVHVHGQSKACLALGYAISFETMLYLLCTMYSYTCTYMCIGVHTYMYTCTWCMYTQPMYAKHAHAIPQRQCGFVNKIISKETFFCILHTCMYVYINICTVILDSLPSKEEQ